MESVRYPWFKVILAAHEPRPRGDFGIIPDNDGDSRNPRHKRAVFFHVGGVDMRLIAVNFSSRRVIDLL